LLKKYTSQSHFSKRYAGTWQVIAKITKSNTVKMAIFWVVAPCSVIEVYRRFRGACCLHHQGNHCPDDGGRMYL
jgi:hypothetical protein